MSDRRCTHLLGELSDFVDGTASAAICREIEHHLADCADCQVVVDTLRQTIHLYRTLPEPALPDGLRRRLYRSLDLERFLSERDQSGP